MGLRSHRHKDISQSKSIARQVAAKGNQRAVPDLVKQAKTTVNYDNDTDDDVDDGI